MALKKYFILIACLFPMLCFATSWKIMPDKSSIHFTATQNNSPVTGEFKTFSGDVDFDPTQLQKSHVKIIVDMNSVTTSFKDVQEALKTADWFDIKLFPHATFVADDFKKISDNTYSANGKLTLRDKTVPIVLNFTLNKYTNQEAIVSGKTQLKRTDFEVGKGEWSSTKQIKDDVTVNFNLEAVKK